MAAGARAGVVGGGVGGGGGGEGGSGGGGRWTWRRMVEVETGRGQDRGGLLGMEGGCVVASFTQLARVDASQKLCVGHLSSSWDLEKGAEDMVSQAFCSSRFSTAVSDPARDAACRAVHLVAHETHEIPCIHWSCLVVYFIEVEKSPRHLAIEKPASLFINVAYSFIFQDLVSLDSVFLPCLCRHILPRMDDSPPDVRH